MMAGEEECNDSAVITNSVSSQLDLSPGGSSLTKSISDAVTMLNISSYIDGNKKYQHQPITCDHDDEENEDNSVTIDSDNIEKIPCAVSSNSASDDENDDCKSSIKAITKLSLVDKLNVFIRNSTDYIDEQMRPMRGYKVVNAQKKNLVKPVSLPVDSAIDDNPPETYRFESELEDLYETLRLRREYSIGDDADPKIIQTLLNIGQLHFEQKEYSTAKTMFLEAFEKLPNCNKRNEAEKNRMLEKMATNLYEYSMTFIDTNDINAAARSLGQALDCYHLAGLQDSEYYGLATKALSDCGTSYDQDYDDVIL